MTMDKIRGLQSVRVSKQFLLKKLEANRTEHEKTYYEILEARHQKVIEALKAELKKAKIDKLYRPSFNLPLPENHTKDYDRAIGMLKASLDDEFELTGSEYDQYVNDDWSWKQMYTTVSGCYITSK